MIDLDNSLKTVENEVLTLLSKESVKHFQKSFGSEAFTDESGRRKKWKKRVYTTGNKNRKILTKRGTLKRSFTYKVSRNKSIVKNIANYSGYHNEGAETVVTQKQLNYFRFRANTAIRSDDADFWNGMASKKVGDLIVLPKRQFMGESKPLVNRSKKAILRTMKQRFKKLNVKSVVKV